MNEMDEMKYHPSSAVELPTDNAYARRHVATQAFAGRVGGNQKDIQSAGDPDVQQPDAAPLSSIRGILALSSFKSVQLWRMALLEGLGSCLFVYLLGAFANGAPLLGLSQPVRIVLASILSWIALALFTYVLGPTTGAHLTPVITMTTLFIGLTTLPRAIFYITAHVIGAVIAGYWLKGGVGSAYFESGIVPGCTVIASDVSPGQMFVLEFGFCLVMIFFACGLGLDPRQHSVLSASYAPMLVGLALGLVNMTSSFAAPGYTGFSFNPARCLGLMAPLHQFQYHYVHWFGPLAAAMVNGIIYRIVPPWTK